MINIDKNIKSHFFDTIILLPIYWTFTGMFLYPNGKKAMVAIVLIAAITSLYKYGINHIKDNLKNNKFIWLLAASSIFAILADSYYGYSTSQLRAFVSLFVYFSILPTQLNSKIELKSLTLTGAATSLIYLLIQMLVYDNYGRTWTINPLPYATFICSIAIMSLYFLLHSNSFKQRALWLIAFITTLLPIFYSQARGLWLALSVAILLLVIKSFINNKKSILLLIPLILVTAIPTYLASDKITQRIEQTISETKQISAANLNTSIGMRLQMWKAALYLSTESPIIGVGDKHIAYKKELAEQGIISSSIIHYSHYHNQFLNELVKYGVIGLLLLLFSIFLPIYYYLKVENQYKRPAIWVLLIFLIASLTDVPFQHAQPITFYFIVMYIALYAAPAPLIKRETSSTF